MKRKSLIATFAVILAAGIGAVTVGQMAQASAGPRTDSQLVSPAVKNGDSGFYSSEQIDKVWSAVVANYPAALPEGYSLPAQTPEFFHPTDVESPAFQAGLPDIVAAQLWRCAWLDASIAGEISADELASALNEYWLLPSTAALDVRTKSDLSDSVLARFAEENSLPSTTHALFALDCQGYKK